MTPFAARPAPNTLSRGLLSGKYQVELDGLYKRCCKCRDYWPADSEFFYRSGTRSDGLAEYCKACYLEVRYPHGRNPQPEEDNERLTAD